MNQIETYSKINDLQGIQALGNAIALSGMFGCDKPEQGIIIALQCMAEGMPPLEMAKNYHIVKGKLSKRADSMLADFRKAGGKWRWCDDLKNPSKQAAVINFEDYTDFAVEYTLNDAKQAGVYNTKPDSPWQRTPAAMLRARLVSETLRAIAPEIVVGVYTPEEASQFDEPIQTAKPALKVAERIEPKPAAKVTKKPKAEEVVDLPIEAVTLEDLVKPFEGAVEAFLDGKGIISLEMGQTWQDAESDIKNDMLADWDNFAKAAGLGGSK